MKNADHEFDELAQSIARQMHAAPRPQAQTGGAAPPALPDPDALAAQIRPHLTPEFVAFVENYDAPHGAAALGGGQRKPFNLGNFLKNLNAIMAVVGPIIGVFTGVPIPPITIPVPTGPGAAPPAGAQ
jgi:hypothetical protein